MAWDPAAIANLGAWYKADSLALSDGTGVASWSDSGPGGFTATQGTAGKRPIYRTNQINGLPALQFTSGNSTFMASGADMSLTSGFTVFVLASVTSVASQQNLIASNAANGLIYRIGTGTAGAPQLAKSGVGSIGYATAAISAATWTLIAADYVNSGTSAFHHFKNGNANGGTTSSTATTGTTTLEIGREQSSAIYFTGFISEILIYGRVLNATERSHVDSYIQDKYAITVGDYVSSGTAWTQNPSDTITASDATAKTATAPKADTVTATDATAKTAALPKADSLTASDASTRAPAVKPADSLTASDATAKTAGFQKADTITAADLFSAAEVVHLGLSDALTASDGLVRALAILRAQADTLTVSDAVAKAVAKRILRPILSGDPLYPDVSLYPDGADGDVLTASDVVSSVLTPTESLEDFLTLTDEFTAAIRRSWTYDTDHLASYGGTQTFSFAGATDWTYTPVTG